MARQMIVDFIRLGDDLKCSRCRRTDKIFFRDHGATIVPGAGGIGIVQAPGILCGDCFFADLVKRVTPEQKELFRMK
jgi:hypothetical protein